MLLTMVLWVGGWAVCEVKTKGFIKTKSLGWIGGRKDGWVGGFKSWYH
jgi:hypothetical protein